MQGRMPTQSAPSTVPSSLEVSRFAEDVDLEAYIRACPRDATTRGTFFQHVCDAAPIPTAKDRARLFAGLERHHWLPFKSYPLTDFMRLAHNAASLSYARFSSAEGLRRIGWMSYPSFASTMAGRVVLFALGNRLEDVVHACQQAYRHSLPLAHVQVTRKEERHYEIEMYNVHSFVDTYHCGVLEGAIHAFHLQPDVRVQRLTRRCDARFSVRWQ
jgi:uncharacterized protein (TIGR02265 family)